MKSILSILMISLILAGSSFGQDTDTTQVTTQEEQQQPQQKPAKKTATTLVPESVPWRLYVIDGWFIHQDWCLPSPGI